MEEEAKPNETMHSGRLSAAEKRKQKAGRALVLGSVGREPRPPAGDDAAANWHAGGGTGVPRHLFLGPPSSSSSDSEIEEGPLSAEDVAPELAAVADLEGWAKEVQVLLDSRLRKLEEAKRRRRDGADEPEPELDMQLLQVQHLIGTAQEEVSDIRKELLLDLRLQDEEMQDVEESWKPVVPLPVAQPQRSNNSKRKLINKVLEEPELDIIGAEVQLLQLQHQVGTIQEDVSDIKDMLLALRQQDEEMQAAGVEPVMPVPQPQCNNTMRMAWDEEMQALEEFCNNSKVEIAQGRRGSVMSVLWILRSIYSSCQRLRISRSCHVPRLIYVCFWLLVLYVLYLIFRPIHGAIAGLLGKHQ